MCIENCKNYQRNTVIFLCNIDCTHCNMPIAQRRIEFFASGYNSRHGYANVIHCQCKNMIILLHHQMQNVFLAWVSQDNKTTSELFHDIKSVVLYHKRQIIKYHVYQKHRMKLPLYHLISWQIFLSFSLSKLQGQSDMCSYKPWLTSERNIERLNHKKFFIVWIHKLWQNVCHSGRRYQNEAPCLLLCRITS